MSAASEDPAPPAEFLLAREAVRSAVPRPELVLSEIPAPAGVAPHSIALAGDVRPTAHGVDSLLGTGRFILLYDADEPEQWEGRFRIVAYAQAPLEREIGVDPFVAEVAWAWLIDALAAGGASHRAASGTATTEVSTGFGELSGADGAQLELRASWTPSGRDAARDMAAHVIAWSELVCMLAGLPPHGDAVGLLPHLRAARD